MTCIVGLEHDGVIYMGCDSALSEADTLSSRIIEDKKVFINGNVIIGCASSLRILQLMHYAFIPPENVENKSDMAYLVTDFIDAVRTMHRDRGVMKKENDLETHDSHFVIGLNGILYVVEDDYQVYQTKEKWSAIGGGAEMALGVMYATQYDKTLTPEQRITLALEAAELYNAGVRRPFYVIKQEKKQ